VPEERHALARAILGSVDSQILPKFQGTVTTESLEHNLTRENLRIGDTSKRNTVNGGKRDRHGGAQPSISDANGRGLRMPLLTKDALTSVPSPSLN